ncbi:MAG: leucyl/phenylalanyl-tRNA--protein transferase [Pseudomonadota bacterium]
MSDKSLTPQVLLAGYASGVFPMAHNQDDPDVFWVRPERRGIFELDRFHISRSLKRRLLRNEHRVRINTRFEAVLAACADRETTWISQPIFDLYVQLHRMGVAHSLEVYDRNDALWGGIYGVALGGAFFGESMFSSATDGSKIALAYTIARLRHGGFTLFDTQFLTDHLARLGAIEISRSDYEVRLQAALTERADFAALSEGTDVHSVIQLITQTS